MIMKYQAARAKNRSKHILDRVARLLELSLAVDSMIRLRNLSILQNFIDT